MGVEAFLDQLADEWFNFKIELNAHNVVEIYITNFSVQNHIKLVNVVFIMSTVAHLTSSWGCSLIEKRPICLKTQMLEIRKIQGNNNLIIHQVSNNSSYHAQYGTPKLLALSITIAQQPKLLLVWGFPIAERC
jgi:hypothetical protein